MCDAADRAPRHRRERRRQQTGQDGTAAGARGVHQAASEDDGAFSAMEDDAALIASLGNQLIAGTAPPVSRSIRPAISSDGVLRRLISCDRYGSLTPSRLAQAARVRPEESMCAFNMKYVCYMKIPGVKS